MPVPDFQSMMLPMLTFLSDGQERVANDLEASLITQLGLTEQDRTELLPSGRSTRLKNRIAWAKAHLKAAGLLESTRHGYFKISELGKKVLSESPSRVDLRFLDQFPSHKEFHTRTHRDIDVAPVNSEDQSRAPIELLEASYQEL